MISLKKNVTVSPMRSAPCRSCNQQLQLTKVNFSARQVVLHGRVSSRGIACRQCLVVAQVPCQEKRAAQVDLARARVESLRSTASTAENWQNRLQNSGMAVKIGNPSRANNKELAEAER